MKKQNLFFARAGIIACLYASLTLIFGNMAHSLIEVRPAEALSMLPLFYGESVIGLFVGCMIANITSAFGIIDVVFGSITTLLSAFLSYLVGKKIKNTWLKILVGGLFSVALNAFIIPLLMVWAGGVMFVYWSQVLSIAITQIVWVYGLGTPLYFIVDKLIKKDVKVMLPLDRLK